jgi:mRNA interferase YafQ
MRKLRDLILLLLAGAPLPERYRDHPLRGSLKRYRDAHIEPDWLLIYRASETALFLARTGTHSDLFDE